jgi:hypothetical protein
MIQNHSNTANHGNSSGIKEYKMFSKQLPVNMIYHSKNQFVLKVSAFESESVPVPVPY